MRVFVPVFVREFYLANTGFFLLVIAFAGGFMRSYDHIALAEFFISSPLVLIIPIGLWFLYSLKVINFNWERIKQNENEFIFCFMLFPMTKQWWMAIRVVLIQLLPAFIYGLFLFLLAWSHDLIYSLFVILIALTLLVLMSAYHLRWSLHHPNHEKKVSFIARFFNLQFAKPFSLFFIEWITRHELVMLLGTKLFSALMIIAITALYKTDIYDLRLLSIGIMIASGANVGLVHALHHFENFHLSWVRSLPIPFLKRIYFSLMTIGIILLPEIILLIKNFPAEQDWHDYVISSFFLISVPFLFYGLLYAKDRNQQEVMTLVFYCGIVWFVLVLFKVPILPLGILNVVTGFVLWKRYYYSFEYVSRKKGAT
ncbi:MAG TPA: hypothetical protein VFG46_30390 [Chryseolinea sp.]|nr:hypothetical protein [Chryseolinea sp.]